MVADLFYGVSEKELAETLIEIENGSGVPGLGYQVAARLQAMGLRSLTVRAARTPVEVTTIIDRGNHRGVVGMIAFTLKQRTKIRREALPGSAAAPDGQTAKAAPRSDPSPLRPGITILLSRDAARILTR
jgi:hypothetical protein